MSKRPYLKARQRSYIQRPVNRRNIRQRFLIVCEGEKTEPGYFLHFRVPKLVVDVQGLGFNTVRLVQEAISQREQLAETASLTTRCGASSIEMYSLWRISMLLLISPGKTTSDLLTRMRRLSCGTCCTSCT